ncbi:hypothetical protein [Nocardia sp. NBC_00416]|uniref:hypothetical protein n=1 Tax=Nocardia sp. NBC_00416 TaxID=2975991 RepID=UPI002E1D2458
MNALIILAVALIAIGLLVSVFLWWRSPDSGESEYVTVAELQARLEHEGEPIEQPTAGESSDDQDRPRTGDAHESANADDAPAEPETPAADETAPPHTPEKPATTTGHDDRADSGSGAARPDPGDKPPTEE